MIEIGFLIKKPIFFLYFKNFFYFYSPIFINLKNNNYENDCNNHDAIAVWKYLICSKNDTIQMKDLPFRNVRGVLKIKGTDIPIQKERFLVPKEPAE